MKSAILYKCPWCGYNWVGEWTEFCPQCESDEILQVARNE